MADANPFRAGLETERTPVLERLRHLWRLR